MIITIASRSHTNNIDTIIDKRLVRFIYNSINHSNKTSLNILRENYYVLTLHFLQTLDSVIDFVTRIYVHVHIAYYHCAKNQIKN